MKLPEIPISWLVAAFIIALVITRVCGYDSWITATLSSIATFLFAKMGLQTQIAQKQAENQSKPS
jgi:hypothetical protein